MQDCGDGLCCQICGKPVSAALPCPGCDALFYCSPAHRRLHAMAGGHDAAECSRMRGQLLQREQLLQHHLGWPCESARSVCRWLAERRWHDEGCLLRHCCPLHAPPAPATHHSNSPTRHKQHRQLSLDDGSWQSAWAPVSAELVPQWTLQQSEQQQQQQQPASWSEYYALRGLPPESPAALALHFPLSLWHCLVHLLPAAGRPLPPPGSTVRVAWLGPQSELLLLPLFAELTMLLPGHHLSIHFIGPDVPCHLHGRATRLRAPDAGGSLELSCWVGCWHDLLEDWSQAAAAAAQKEEQLPTAGAAASSSSGEWGEAAMPPPLAAGTAVDSCWHLVFAPNAGLPAFPSWLPSLQLLGQHGDGVQVIFTDYCEEAAVRSQQMVAALLPRPFSLAPRVNPFRQPAPAAAHGTRLPACSNAFFFGWA